MSFSERFFFFRSDTVRGGIDGDAFNDTAERLRWRDIDDSFLPSPSGACGAWTGA